MTESTVKPEVIKKTQDTLGKFVKKPPLSEKLLKKPPFKFLHDIINVVIHDTKFMEGLFSPDELNSENVKDREAKIKFLQKVIDVVKLVTKQNLSVKPSKIVAGLEAELTNELLQAIGIALENKLDSKEAVESVKSGNVPAKTKSKSDVKEKGSLTRNPSKESLDKKSKEKKASRQASTDKVITRQGSTDKLNKQGSTERIIPIKASDKTITKLKTKDKEKGLKEKDATKRSTSKPRNPEVKEKEKPQKPVKKSVHPKDEPKVNGEIIATTERQNGEIIETTANHASLQSNEESEKKSITEIKENGDLITDEISMNHNEADSIEPKINGNSHLETEEIPAKPVDELAAIIDEEAEMRKKERLSRKLSSKHRQKTVEESQDKSSENNENVAPENPSLGPAPVVANVPLPLIKQNSKDHHEKPERFHSSYKRDSFDRPKTASLRPPSARPPSARPAAPRRRDKNIEIVLQPDDQMKMNDISVKMESFSKELEDDGENLLIIEDPTLATDNLIGNRIPGIDSGSKMNENDDHGHLVQQILETQKEFSGVLGMGDDQSQKKTEIEYDETVMANQRQSSAKQVDQLKDLIQRLTRSVNPMGKLMDFVQEDIDSMQREYTKWHEIYKTATFELKNKQTETANAIEPLKHQLTSLENSIKEHRDMIDGIRSNIITNEQKILKIFTDT